MKRLHTRVKRLLGVTKSRWGLRNTEKKSRPRTFLTEEKAREYATGTMKLSDSSYTIASAKRDKKFKIVPNEKAE
ncbi:hypothetical protein J4401_05965 [Candidatus Woesearchaeota archaeon]|nr:hypothetical protein [Candidatus Woesearchaeota archaeon]